MAKYRIIFLLTLIAWQGHAQTSKKWDTQITYTAAGTNTYTVTITGYPYYRAGDELKILFTNANSGTSTLNVNSLGAIGLRKNGSTPLSSGDISAGTTYILSYDGTNFQVLNIPGAGGGGGGGGGFVISSTAPATNVRWIDTNTTVMQANPIRDYVNGAWTAVTDECDWWDQVGQVVSKGKPIAILFSGQSNVGSASYFPAGEPTYTGDVAISNHVALWQPTTTEWKVYLNNAATAGNRTWTAPGGTVTDDLFLPGKTNQIWVFAKLYAKQFNRSVRLVGTRRGGQPLAQWEAGNSAWTELVSIASASGVPRFDAFIWIHGEAELFNALNPSSFTFYKDSFYDFIGRLRAQSWADEKLKIIMPSHVYNNALLGGHSSAILSNAGDLNAEGTARSLDNQDSPYTGWAAWASGVEAQEGASDPFHMTSREQERQGAAIYSTYLSLPNYRRGDRLIRTFYTNTANRLTQVKAVTPGTDDFEWAHSGLSSAGTYKRSFSFVNGFGYNPDIQEVVSGIGSSYSRWEIKSSAYGGIAGVLETKMYIDNSGVNIPKTLNLLGATSLNSNPWDGAIIFTDVGGTANDMWLAKDASNSRALIYKVPNIIGQHRFAIGDNESFRIWNRGTNAIDAINSELGIYNSSNTDSVAPTQRFFRTRGTYAAQTPVTSGDQLGSISFLAPNSTIAEIEGARIDAIATTVNSGVMATDLRFYTATTSAAVERLRISSAGAFGMNGTNYGTSGQVLTSQGSSSAPIWSAVSLTSGVNGTLPIANGGTNRSSLGSAFQVLRVNAGGTDTEWATISGGGGTYYAPNVLSPNATDANFTAAVNSIRHLPDGVLTANRTITIPTGADGDVIKLLNNEDTFIWFLSGATVYLADRTTVVTQLLYNVPTIIQKINGLWIIEN